MTPVAMPPLSAATDGALLAAGVPTERFLAHWWIVPAWVLVATVALGAGVSGSLFFSHFVLLIVGLSPPPSVRSS